MCVCMYAYMYACVHVYVYVSIEKHDWLLACIPRCTHTAIKFRDGRIDHQQKKDLAGEGAILLIIRGYPPCVHVLCAWVCGIFFDYDSELSDSIGQQKWDACVYACHVYAWCVVYRIGHQLTCDRAAEWVWDISSFMCAANMHRRPWSRRPLPPPMTHVIRRCFIYRRSHGVFRTDESRLEVFLLQTIWSQLVCSQLCSLGFWCANAASLLRLDFRMVEGHSQLWTVDDLLSFSGSDTHKSILRHSRGNHKPNAYALVHTMVDGHGMD